MEDGCNFIYPSYSASRLRSDTCCVCSSCKLHLTPVSVFSHIYCSSYTLCLNVGPFLKCDIRSAACECYLQEADETVISDEV